MSIRLKLIIAFLAITIIPTITISIISYFNGRNALISTHLAELESIAKLKVDKIESYFFERRGDIRVIQDYYNIKTNLPIVTEFANDRKNAAYKKAKKMLDDQLETVKAVYKYAGLMLISPDGKIVYAVNEAHTKMGSDYLLSNHEGIAFEEGKKGIYFSDIYKSSLTEDKFQMLITAPIHDFNGIFTGVVALMVDMESAFGLMQDITGLGNTGETIVGKEVGDSAIFLNRLRHDKDSALKRKVDYGEKAAFPIREAVKGRSGSGLSVDYRGVEVMAAWRHVPLMNWGLMAKIDTAEAFVSVNHLKNMSLIIMGAFIIISAVLALLLARLLSAPIVKLTRRTMLIADGDLTTEINITRGDEIGQLANSFNNMVNTLKQTQEELVRKERYAAIGRISGAIAHDVRHPLATIKNSAYFLNITLNDQDEKTKKHLKLINDEIAHADEILKFIVQRSEYKKAEKSRTNINDFVNEYFSKVTVPEHIKLATELDKECPDIMVDRLQLERVFANLTLNAAQAMPEGGSLTVKARRVRRSECGVWNKKEKTSEYRIPNSELRTDFAEISFADSGIGIKKNIMDRIFDPFYTTKSSGTGIGLSIVRDIITSNNGEITVESEEGKGSAFKMVFQGIMD